MEIDSNNLIEEDKIKIKKQLLESLQNYNKTMSYMICDAPIETLCLKKDIENILINIGCLRIYDLLDRDLTKIKGLGVSRIRDLTTRLNEFLSIS